MTAMLASESSVKSTGVEKTVFRSVISKIKAPSERLKRSAFRNITPKNID